MREKRKEIRLTLEALTIAFLITVGTIFLYKNLKPDSNMVFHVIQTVSYLLMILDALIFMKLSGKAFREFGLFKDNIPKQILSALIMTAVLMVLAFITGWRPSEKEEFWLIAFQQVFVAFSEELLFRGFVLTMFKDIFISFKDVLAANRRAIFWSSLLFGLWHFPWGQSIGQVITTFIVGAICASLRGVYEDTDWEIGVPALAVLHWAMNTIL